MYFYPAGPQVYVLLFAVVGLILLLGERIGGLRRIVERALPQGIGGVVRALALGSLMIAVGVVLLMMLELGGAVHVDPGGWIAVVGGAVYLIGSRTLPADGPIPIRGKMSDVVEIVVVAVAMLAMLMLFVRGLVIDEQESFAAYAAFVGFLAYAVSKAGLIAWVSQVAGRHYGVTVAAAFVVAALFPFTQSGNNRYLNVMANVLIFAVVAMGLNIVIGLAGSARPRLHRVPRRWCLHRCVAVGEPVLHRRLGAAVPGRAADRRARRRRWPGW